MKLTSILNEANRQSVILIDFQPAYDSDQYGYRNALKNAIEYLNKKHPSQITVFFNGMYVGIEDTSSEVMYHYTEYGLDEDILDNFNMIEKWYGFFRGWIDQGVDEAFIIKFIRYMVNNRINDSREIDENVFEELNNGEYDIDNLMIDPIHLPDISLAQLKQLSGSLIGGGGRHECLKELTLLMNAFNIKYKLVDSWIYG